MAPFELRKDYFDLCTDDGRVRILYAAVLRWAGVEWTFGSVLRSDGDEAGPATSRSCLGVSMPATVGDVATWSCPKLGVDYSLSRSQTGPRSVLLRRASESLEWHCHTLRGVATLVDGEETLVGPGYGESLTSSIPPWNLPWDALRWGRVHERDRSLVWTVLEGPSAPEPIFASGVDALGRGTVGDGGVTLPDGARVRFMEERVLRDGRIGETVLRRLPRSLRLPGRILGLTETKRYLRTPSGGHVIEERVVWPPRS